MTNRELIDAAKDAMQYAYVPYSKYGVGAALLCKSGKVYTGCNIENASYGATNCAERTAFYKAISEGERDFEKMAVVSVSDDITFPCGICRQVMAEFMRDGDLLFENKNGEIIEMTVHDVMPHMFDETVLEDL